MTQLLQCLNLLPTWCTIGKRCFLIHFASAAANQAVLFYCLWCRNWRWISLPPCSCALPIIIIVLPPSCLPPQAETRDGRGRREGAGGNGVERGRQTDRSGGKEGRKEGSVNRVIYFPLSSILNKSGQLWTDVNRRKICQIQDGRHQCERACSRPTL